MGWFKNLFNKTQTIESKPIEKQVSQDLALFDNIVKVYSFDIFIKRINNVDFNVGDTLTIKHLPSIVSNAIDAVVFYNNTKLGYLSHIEARILRDLYGKQDYNCVIDSFNDNEMFVKIKLPYIEDKILIPMVITLVGVTFNNRQHNISYCTRKDLVLVKHEPTNEYSNNIIVYDNKSKLDIGVIPDKIANKIIKKYGKNCLFYGCIKSLYGEPNIGVDIYLLTQNEYPINKQ